MKESHSISAFGGRPPRQGAIDSGKASEAIQTDLGIIGSAAAGPDLTILQPALKARATASGVEIDWNWSGFAAFLDALQIEVDRGDIQGWRLLVHDTTPGYKDTAPTPRSRAGPTAPSTSRTTPRWVCGATP